MAMSPALRNKLSAGVVGLILARASAQQILDQFLDEKEGNSLTAYAERDRRMAEAATRINWLEAAQQDGDISADEEAELTALRVYRTTLRRLDLSVAPDINWPVRPGT